MHRRLGTLPLPHPPLLTPARAGGWLGRQVDGWAVRSQQRARRNAMVALTALTQRRAERTEVEEYLASRRGAAPTGADAAPAAAHG